MVRLEEEGLIEALQSRAVLLEGQESIAPVVMGFHIIRLEQDGPVEAHERRLVLQHGIQRSASVVVGFRMARIQKDNLVIALRAAGYC